MFVIISPTDIRAIAAGDSEVSVGLSPIAVADPAKNRVLGVETGFIPGQVEQSEFRRSLPVRDKILCAVIA